MKNIVETALGNPMFSTLVTAVKAAGLVDTLSGTGPFTVFAPTNDAFAKIPADTLKGVLADKAKLTSILTYQLCTPFCRGKPPLHFIEVKVVPSPRNANTLRRFEAGGSLIWRITHSTIRALKHTT